jgi:NADPH-dependent ferric siderophore reductase
MMEDIINQFRDPMEHAPAVRRVQRVRHELKRREAQVLRVERLGARFTAITFGGEQLADFVSASFDDHVKFFFPGPGGEMLGRDYTPRRFDAGKRELTLEFALHGDGPAATWARGAQPGDRVVIGGPRGSFIIPADYAWHLLAGDASALPAIHRRLEELPAGAQAIVIVQVDDAADQRAFDSRARVDLRWVRDSGEFLAALEGPALPGEGYAWCAGEASVMAGVRDILLAGKKHPREAARIAAYWKRGAAGHHENLE